MALYDLTTVDFDEEEEYDDDDSLNENSSMESSEESLLDAEEIIKNLNNIITKLATDHKIKDIRLEKVQSILGHHKSKLKDKNKNTYAKEVVYNSHKLLECLLEQHQQMFGKDYFHYSVYFIRYFFIPGSKQN